MTSMFVFSCISGGYFVSQTSILATLMNSIQKSNKDKKKIDFYFGNSGGAISNIIALQYSGEKETMERVLYSIESSMFLNNWVSDPVPFSSISSKFISLFKSSFYDQGKGSKKLLDTFYTSRQLKETESWIGKFNVNNNKTDLLCICSENNSKLNPFINKNYMIDFSNVSKIEYADGNKEKIADTLNATSSLPGLKPSIKIENNHYMDGGLGSSSTGSLLLNSIKKYADANDTNKYQFFYIIGPNYSILENDLEGHWIKELSGAINKLTRSMIYRERQQIFETWMNIVEVSDISSLTKVTLKNENEIINFFNGGEKHFFATGYTNNKKLNIINFDLFDLKKIFNETNKGVYFEIYYKN